MEDIMLVCKYGEERVAAQSCICTSYSKLVEVIREKWGWLRNEHLNLLYSTPGLDKFLLKDSDDFSSMLRMASIFSLRYMEIDVKAPFAKKDAQFDIACNSNTRATVTDIPSSSNNLLIEQSIVVPSSSDAPLLSAYWGMGISHIGQGFPGGRFEFRAALIKYAVDRGFTYSMKRNDKEMVVAHCRDKDKDTKCPWFISATICRTNDYFIIRKFVNYHTCSARLNREESKKLTSSLVAELIIKALASKEKPWAANDVSHHFKEFYGQTINYRVSYNALGIANRKLLGDDAGSYEDLLWYTRAATELNPGSKIVLEVDYNTTFLRIFLSWGACIEGFKSVRPLLFLDGTHLRGKFKGCLLSATGKNANQELYPLAYAVVDSENADNWLWFLQCLKDVIGDDREITFVSDRNLGLLDSIPKVFPDSENFFCMRHLEDNLRGRYNGKVYKGMKDRIVILFKKCAKAATPTKFARCLDEFLREGGSIAKNFLEGMPYENWTNAFSSGSRYGEMTSNAAESFNSWVKEPRYLPVRHCIDKLREKLMLWFNIRKTKSATWTGYICPRMEKKLDKLISQGRTWRVRNADSLVFEVLSTETNTVDYRNHTCTCRKWQLKGFPCAHAVACVNNSPLRLENLIEDYWFVGSYRRSYEIAVMPIATATKEQYMLAGDSQILPPLTRRPPGRPKTQRYKTKGERENKKLIRCSRCKQLGNHNKKSCNAPI